MNKAISPISGAMLLISFTAVLCVMSVASIYKIVSIEYQITILLGYLISFIMGYFWSDKNE